MTNKDFKYTPLNERELSLLFDETQKTMPEMSEQFLERLQNQAIEAALKKPQIAIAPEERPLFDRLANILAQAGSWLPRAGLVSAMFFGVLLVFNTPEFVLDIPTAFSQMERLSDLVGLSDELGIFLANTLV
ncbi:MAG: hypothetical protein VXA09_05990, partial [Burkholderiaceae bacterium]